MRYTACFSAKYAECRVQIMRNSAKCEQFQQMMCHDVRRMSGNLFLKNIKREILFSCFPEIDVLPYPWQDGTSLNVETTQSLFVTQYNILGMCLKVLSKCEENEIIKRRKIQRNIFQDQLPRQISPLFSKIWQLIK